MKAQELRIGNLISYHGRVIEVEGVFLHTIYHNAGFDSDTDESCRPFKPIHLTEQWLIDFGFERGVDYWFKGDVILDISPEGLSYRFHYNIIQYVHCLQNLYFALTGEDLQL